MNFNDYLNNRAKLPDFTKIKHVSQQIAEDNYASKFATHILKQVNEFNNKIGENFEVGVCLANFGQVVQFPVTAIGYIDPSLIIFYGRAEDGSPCQLIQHVSQINFGLLSFKKKDDTPKEPIGFRCGDDE